MSNALHVAVVGSINRDDVAGTGIRNRHGWGGILFNVAALLRHGESQLTITPIAHLGTDAKQPVEGWLARHRQINTDGLVPLNRRGNLCRLRYHGPDHRDERLLYRVPPLTWTRLRPALTADITLINYISGRDVAIRDLERFRREYRGTIYIDVHSLLLGRRGDGTRYERRPAHWKRMIDCADVIQVNEREFEILSRRTAGTDAVRDWANTVLWPGRCRCLIVTRADRGSLGVFRKGRGWQMREFESGRRQPIPDPTGAGDTFSGAWIAKWLADRDPYTATHFATRAASRPARPPI
ncbi:MAG: hypothetical protein GF341_03610 [candidate division Zixibacteria bacterium]|nr:hypothetical protein [candidate division Zixibacteria bacterium]